MKVVPLFALTLCMFQCATGVTIANTTPPSASNAGSPQAHHQSAARFYEQGMKYFGGKGEPQSYAAALPLITRAANLGYAKAETQLGTMYQEGYGVAASNHAAAHWFAVAADQGNSTGLNNLGNLYLHGLGVKRDYAKARTLFEQAAALNNPTAQANLGWMYFNGLGVKRDCNKAVALYRRASTQNDPSGESNMAAAHFFGCGASQNDTTALKWALIAQSAAIAQPGQVTTAERRLIQNNVINLRARLNAQEINRAQSEALKWKPSE